MELIAERFHASPALLAQLNPGVAIAAGAQIKVPAVAPFNPDTKPPADPAAADVTIQVSKQESALRATRADGTLVFYAPVSSGSVHDPLPPGDFKVLGVVWISLSLEHYGLHGTPEPGNVGHTQSHGCVRLTNWDAARVASLVKPGTPVRFK
jgi:lipoprotein-anchoring transpeptidase ErfK/SrfK